MYLNLSTVRMTIYHENIRRKNGYPPAQYVHSVSSFSGHSFMNHSMVPNDIGSRATKQNPRVKYPHPLASLPPLQEVTERAGGTVRSSPAANGLESGKMQARANTGAHFPGDV
jgi:hypothetical protein